MSAEPNVRTLTIDGEEISARSDQTILDAAREHNIGIPTLCHLEGLSEVGACRLCLVEVKGARRLLPRNRRARSACRGRSGCGRR